MSEIKGVVHGAPVEGRKRHVILDALRGFALLGICLANYPEFSLYSFLDNGTASALPTADVDNIVQYLLYIFIDGKFYTIFSLLFGIGFSIILTNNKERGANGIRIFYRRMFFLLLIGLGHLMFLWSGDILMLYALGGMILPVFIGCKDRTLFIWAIVFLCLPVIVDFIGELVAFSLSSKLLDWQWVLCERYGITEANFAYWLRDADTYGKMLDFLKMGAVERTWEFVESSRYFKVLGLFIIGFYIGRHRLYARISELKNSLKKLCVAGLGVGLPLSGVYAWSAMTGKPFGSAAHSFLYFISVYISSFGYIAAICLLYESNRQGRIWRVLSFPGRMALTNYIGQSIVGIFIFYGIGFGLGATMGLIYADAIAVGVFILEIAISCFWLRYFRFGPLEWIWRCLTYWRFFKITKKPSRE